MSLPPLASTADLESHLGRSLAPAAAELAIRRASGRVRSYTRQQISFQADDTIEMPGGDRILRVPQRPLVVDVARPLTVIEVGEFGAPDMPLVEGVDFARLGNELTRGYPYHPRTRLLGWPWNRSLGVWAPTVRLTYSHGYITIPDDIVDVVLELATVNVTNVEGLRSESIDDYSRTYATETVGGAKLTADHKEALRSYRIGAFSVRQS
ncbi:hypothetical protein ABZ897_00860 [Nonomuraea sp. NPDC046802]|uniref:hypothetical protein n=1 Tax=Nonomuraea sp. NPDC046802 TaxID=3154919 RepID=UPI0033DA7171